MHPGAYEECTDGVDNDCDGLVDENMDEDGDGVTNCDGDCDDGDASVHPGAAEIPCDGVDNDCDGSTPDAPDADNDGIDACSGDCDDSDPGIGVGTWVPQDFPTIQDAISAACHGDVICVDAGTYTEFVDFDGKDVHLLGVFGPAQTILQPPGPGAVVTFADWESADAILQGFTITGGYGPDSGGEIVIDSTSPTLTELVVTGNESDMHGGGIYTLCRSGVVSPTFSHMIVSDNRAGYSGGGIYLAAAGASRSSARAPAIHRARVS